MAEEERIIMNGNIPAEAPDQLPEPVEPPKRFHLGPPMKSANEPENGRYANRRMVVPGDRVGELEAERYDRGAAFNPNAPDVLELSYGGFRPPREV